MQVLILHIVDTFQYGFIKYFLNEEWLIIHCVLVLIGQDTQSPTCLLNNSEQDSEQLTANCISHYIIVLTKSKMLVSSVDVV